MEGMTGANEGTGGRHHLNHFQMIRPYVDSLHTLILLDLMMTELPTVSGREGGRSSERRLEADSKFTLLRHQANEFESPSCERSEINIHYMGRAITIFLWC